MKKTIHFLCAALFIYFVFSATVLACAAVSEGARVPILMYHGVSDETWGLRELFVRVEDMERELQYLAENGYTAITFPELDRAGEFEKPVLLTFDDGYRDNYENLFPLLKKYNMKATLFVITESIGADNFLTADMLREMAASGLVSIQSHTRVHPDLTTLSRGNLKKEMEGSANDIEAMIGRRPVAVSYPAGSNNAAVREIAAQIYQYGVTTKARVYVQGSDPMRIGRLRVSRGTTMAQFEKMLKR